MVKRFFKNSDFADGSRERASDSRQVTDCRWWEKLNSGQYDKTFSVRLPSILSKGPISANIKKSYSFNNKLRKPFLLQTALFVAKILNLDSAVHNTLMFNL